MIDHTVTVTAEDMTFAPTFNVAVPFIDRHLGEGRGDKVAIRTNHGENVTYGELADGVNRAGNALKDLGIARGDRVLMVVKDDPVFHYVFWGAIKAGFVPVPLNTLLRSKDYEFVIPDSRATVVVWSPEFDDEVVPALEAANPGPLHRLRTEGEGATIRSLLEQASPVLDPVSTTALDDCFWLYSSGSTGNPKGAIHRHRDMVVTSQRYGVETLGATEDDTFFSAAKLFFAYGLGNGMTFPLWVGGTAILFDGRPTPETTFDIISRYRPTLYFGVPTLYAAQLAGYDELEPDTSSIRLCVSAGEALPPDILRRWKECTGLDILDGIGSTELLHIFISNLPGDIRPGATGKPVPGYEARIVDEDGNDVPVGDSGRLLDRGHSAARAYWNNPEKTAATMYGDDWLDTGDTYVRDEDGYFYYQGRSDDMMKVGGIWTSPFEIEAKLMEHPLVLEAAIVGREDDADLVKPAAVVVLTDASAAGENLVQELQALCKEGLAPYKYPRWIDFVEDLPKTATGKIQRFKLRETSQQPTADG
ncbi:MAG: benzoate-CoA ligase family protein [Acidimicrobiia bacterium]|nr:MAG: benzoate-CoA ligase family protein [Acidimicrobiia bacterium]